MRGRIALLFHIVRVSILEDLKVLIIADWKADPIIFRGFKSLTLADSQQQSLLRLALEGISVQQILHCMGLVIC